MNFFKRLKIIGVSARDEFYYTPFVLYMQKQLEEDTWIQGVFIGWGFWAGGVGTVRYEETK